MNNVTGKVSKPAGGWEDVTGEVREARLPNPTNKQTSRLLTGWTPSLPQERNLRQAGPQRSQPELRCRSVGRPRRDPVGQQR